MAGSMMRITSILRSFRILGYDLTYRSIKIAPTFSDRGRELLVSYSLFIALRTARIEAN
jgi:hypothetical protein